MRIIFRYIFLILLIIILLIVLFRREENNNYINRGEELINKIELFRSKYNRLPNSIEELGIIEPMGEGPYYEKKDSLRYIIYFNIGFDNAKIYHSETKKWENKP